MAADQPARASFRATLELHGRTATGVEVPAHVVDALGAGKKPAVEVTVGPAGAPPTHTYRSTVAVMGGRYLLGISAENRAAAGVQAGDELDIDVVLDTAPRVVAVPTDLAAALAVEPTAAAAFEALAYSHQQRHVLAVEGAKTAETRARRIAKAVADLRAGGS